ncbi:T-complex protein 11 X-linked protein 1-like [Ochotona curzoniae]|uniref:T-complex protein 11 X-linked protein 1-like n=1 Tax=Ochotona curzoniae TaxID=130825 RepID=UPI001B34FA71|nr:T-complex protein 11 X-linked protein 1-like [Ochotona curzoniae]
MPKIKEDSVLQNDSSEAESKASEASGKTQENKSGSTDDHPPELIETINKVSKMSIAHEIVVNQNFYIEEKMLPPDSVQGRFVETMYNVLWDHLKEQLSRTPSNFSCALDLLKEIKDILLSLLLPHQSPIQCEIEEVLDMDRLKKDVEQGTLDVHHLSSCILNFMIMLCAPIRDEAVHKLGSITDPIELLRGVFHVLGLMKMDMVNYTIQSLRPYLKEYSVLYERAKFQELLDRQPHLLFYTKKWLAKAAADLTIPFPNSPDSARMVAYSQQNQEATNSDIPSPTMVLYQGYLNLLHWDHKNEEFPETLLMDRMRLQEMASTVCQLSILTSVLLVARSFSGGVLFRFPGFVDRLKDIINTLMEEYNTSPEEAMLSVNEQVSQEIHQGLKNIGLDALSHENKNSLKGQLQNIAKKENCIRVIIVPAHRSTDPYVSQMLFGSWNARVFIRYPWRP